MRVTAPSSWPWIDHLVSGLYPATNPPIVTGKHFVTRKLFPSHDRIPSRFMLIAALNPCPCGYYGDPNNECSCTSTQILKYQKKISGPMLDRIDIHIDVPAVKAAKIVEDEDILVESSKVIRERVVGARKTQNARFKDKKIITNSEMTNRDIKESCKIDDAAREVLKQALVKLALSARAYHKVIKVAQTIADLSRSPVITREHILEALQYRPKLEA